MADNSPDNQTSRNNEIIRQGLTEAQILNVAQASERITKILEEDPNLRDKFYESLKNDLIKTVVSNPALVQQVLEVLNQKFEERLASGNIEAKDRINAIKNYTDLILGIGHKITEATLNIPGDNDLIAAEKAFKHKNESLTATYGSILRKLQLSIAPENNQKINK